MTTRALVWLLLAGGVRALPRSNLRGLDDDADAARGAAVRDEASQLETKRADVELAELSLDRRSRGRALDFGSSTIEDPTFAKIVVEVTATIQGITSEAFENDAFVSAFKTTVAAITGVDADMVTNLIVDGVPVNRRLTDSVEVSFEIVVAANDRGVDALQVAADTFGETMKNEVQKIATDSPGDQEAAGAVDLADQATAFAINSVVVSQKLAPTPQPTPAPTAEPTVKPTGEPTAEPSSAPTGYPTAAPTAKPTGEPTSQPTAEPTPCTCDKELEVTVTTGNNPGATSWTVTGEDCRGSAVVAQIEYGEYVDKKTTYVSEKITLCESGTYEFEILDWFACEQSISYSLTLDGVEIKRVGDFACSDVYNFFGTNAPAFSPRPTFAPTTSPAPTVTLVPTAVPTSAPTIAPTCKCDKKEFKLTVRTDGYPDEISYTVSGEDCRTEGTESVFAERAGTASGFYRNYYRPRATYVEEITLCEGGSYTFKILDYWGDGICCSHGDGFYSLTLDGVEIKRGGDFGGSDVYEFFGTSKPTFAPTVTPKPTAYPSPRPTLAPIVPTPRPTPRPTPLPTPRPTCPPGSFDNLEGILGGEPVCEACNLLNRDCEDCECDDFSALVEANCKAACDPVDPCPPGSFDNLEDPRVCEACNLLNRDCADCECDDFSVLVEANCKAACDPVDPCPPGSFDNLEDPRVCEACNLLNRDCADCECDDFSVLVEANCKAACDPVDPCPPGSFDNLEDPRVCEACNLLDDDCADCECDDFSVLVEANCKAACGVPTPRPSQQPTPRPTSQPTHIYYAPYPDKGKPCSGDGSGQCANVPGLGRPVCRQNGDDNCLVGIFCKIQKRCQDGRGHKPGESPQKAASCGNTGDCVVPPGLSHPVCRGGLCLEGDPGSSCGNPSDCVVQCDPSDPSNCLTSGICRSDVCQSGLWKASCGVHDDCIKRRGSRGSFGKCLDGECQNGKPGDDCENDNDCGFYALPGVTCRCEYDSVKKKNTCSNLC